MSTQAAGRADDARTAAAAAAGVVRRSQLLREGWTYRGIDAQIAADRWRPLNSAVVSTSNADPTTAALRWAALLSAPEQTSLAHRTAAEVLGFGARDHLVHLRVPDSAHRPKGDWFVVHRSRIEAVTRVVDGMPVTSPEDTVIDLVRTAWDDDTAMSAVFAACRSRGTTPQRLVHRLDTYGPVPRGALLRELCSAAGAGVESALELRYQRDVEQRHRLLVPSRQAIAVGPGGRVRRDVEYSAYRTIVELDGRLGHEDQPFRDRRRDNASTARGRQTLRYGWWELVRDACGVAGEVYGVLRRAGYEGPFRRCRHCPAR